MYVCMQCMYVCIITYVRTANVYRAWECIQIHEHLCYSSIMHSCLLQITYIYIHVRTYVHTSVGCVQLYDKSDQQLCNSYL